MKLYEFKNKVDLVIVSAALTIAILPVFGLISESAISFGLYGVNYKKVALEDDPQRYWFIIKLEFAVVLWLLTSSVIRFPFIESAQTKIVLFRKKNRVTFFFVTFLIIPVIVTGLIILIIAMV